MSPVSFCRSMPCRLYMSCRYELSFSTCSVYNDLQMLYSIRAEHTCFLNSLVMIFLAALILLHCKQTSCQSNRTVKVVLQRARNQVFLRFVEYVLLYLNMLHVEIIHLSERVYIHDMNQLLQYEILMRQCTFCDTSQLGFAQDHNERYTFCGKNHLLLYEVMMR